MGGLAQLLGAGGPVIWLLAALSVLSVGLIVLSLMGLRGIGAGPLNAALTLWAEGDRQRATRALATRQDPGARLLAAAMEGIAARRSRADLTAELEWRGNAEIGRLSRHLRALELIAMIAPLLGLLGTVLGMIQAFRELALAEGAANASILAAGIWQALLTTAAGLIVAIPAAVAASLIGGRIERAGRDYEALIGRLWAIESGGARRGSDGGAALSRTASSRAGPAGGAAPVPGG